MIVDGEMDEYPENAFFNVGTLTKSLKRRRLNRLNVL